MGRPSPCGPGGAPLLVRALTLWFAPLTACAPSPAAPDALAAPTPPARAELPAFDAARAWSDLEKIVAFGARVSGSKRIENLREFLDAELSAAGLEPVREAFEATTPIGPIRFCNVYADLAGESTGAPQPIVLLATHFDTKRLEVDFDGANDGGSGTAVLLELARQLAAGEPRSVTYRFLFLDGEEAIRPFWSDPDNRYGSLHHAQRLKETGELERVAAAVVLDMVGDADLQFFTDTYSDPRLLSLFFETARELGLGRHVDGRREPVKDDHLSFRSVGIPSVDLIDLDYGPNNSYWHTADDVLANCSVESLRVTGHIVLAALPRLEEFVRGNP